MSLNEIFARNLRKRRAQMKITQEELAERARLTRNYIGNLERGEKSPTLDALEAIAEALGLTPSELIDTDLWHKSDIKKI